MSAIRGICGSASAFLLVCLAAACGGGGSSGQGGDFGTGLSIDTTTVSFSGATSEPADYLSGTTWLRIGPSDSSPQPGPSPGILTLFAEPPLSAGAYSATLHIAIAGQTFDVPISLQVTP